ncbi:ribosome small subunit-dependent GTPase A [uncultured Peptoniphilus sp.]|uniref:ribosome small subunit-dependent GTPase A n=1 Tax=uncultured Peptoniphilus sp. TaxID=254354 RepID=UPI002804EEF7|nr:ribosome small subunit-dependent GTPase A [uncultured Peptoniphilus sp.]
MKGKIIKLTGGFYYIKSGDEIIETRAKGAFRYLNESPIVGDNVEFQYDNKSLGYIQKIYPRKNILTRPKVSNVDLALIVVPLKNPDYNLTLIDKMIAQVENSSIEIFIVVNKSDLNFEEAKKIKEIYERAGFKSLEVSATEYLNMELLKEKLKNKTTALCGVSGSGKSTISSYILNREIVSGEVSKKNGRGRHTTRHTELLFNEDYYIFDTPGFSSLDLNIKSEDLVHYFREFEKYLGGCKFNNCKHLNEPGCQIKEKVKEGEIPQSRYENYKYLYEELKSKEEY